MSTTLARNGKGRRSTRDAWMEWTCSTAGCTPYAGLRRASMRRSRIPLAPQGQGLPEQEFIFIHRYIPHLHSVPPYFVRHACTSFRTPAPRTPLRMPPILVAPHLAPRTITSHPAQPPRFPSPFRVLRRLSPRFASPHCLSPIQSQSIISTSCLALSLSLSLISHILHCWSQSSSHLITCSLISHLSSFLSSVILFSFLALSLLVGHRGQVRTYLYIYLDTARVLRSQDSSGRSGQGSPYTIRYTLYTAWVS